VTEHRFQIHLGGIIDLLSNHLYSSPSVYVRELLQNATDAIRARRHHDEDAPAGSVRITVHERGPQITFEDNGIGLTEDEVHEFLSTIGASSKREELDERRRDFIGQFGIGLLSCFVVSDEISVLTRSAKGGPTIAWRGRNDGTYEIEVREEDDAPVGTTVHLSCKPEHEEWFALEKVEELAGYFGALLPFPVVVDSAQGSRRINDEPPPWRTKFESAADARDASLSFGKRLLGREDFFDVLPLRCEAGEVEGLAYVLPYAPSPTAPPSHRVYLKDMLLSERADNLLPRWAFFVTCVLNTNSLRPTASRESFYEDRALADARKALGVALRDYLLDLQRNDPRRLELLISLHYRAIKALAAHDTEFLALFLDVLPFETSMGRMTFRQIRERFDRIRFAPTVDVFRQIAQVASAQGIGVINAGYSYDADLLRRAPEVFPELHIEKVDATDLADALRDPSDAERAAYVDLVATAGRILAPYRCDVDLKRFAPPEVPVLFVSGDDAAFARSVEASKQAQHEESLWGGMLDNLAGDAAEAKATLVFNAESPLVVRLARVSEEALTKVVPMLYVQALLLGHHPLSADEMSLLNVGLLDLIEWGLGSSGPLLQ